MLFLWFMVIVANIYAFAKFDNNPKTLTARVVYSFISVVGCYVAVKELIGSQ